MSDAYGRPVYPGQPQAAGQSVAAPPAAAPAAKRGGTSMEPQSLGQLASLLINQLLKSLPMQIVLGLIIFIGVWVLHTYLLAGPNEGFNVMGGPFGWFLSQILALQGFMAGSTGLWFALSLLVSAVVGGMVQRKGAFFTGLGRVR